MLLSALDCLIHGEEYEECDDQEEIELDAWTFAAILIIFYCCQGRMKKKLSSVWNNFRKGLS